MLGYALTMSLTYGGAAVALVRPFYGVLAYIALSLLNPQSLWPWSVPPGSYAQIVGIATILGWIVNGAKIDGAKQANPIVISFMLFWVWSFLSYCLASDQSAAWWFVDLLGKVLVPFLIAFTSAKTPRDLRALCWTIALCTGFIAVRQNEIYLQTGVPVGDNPTAHIMAIGAPVAFFLGMDVRNIPLRLGLWASAALMVHAVLFHMSRGGMLGVVCCGLLSFAFLPKKFGHMCILAAALAVGLYLAGDNVWAEFETIMADKDVRDNSAQSRLDLWADMWGVTLQNPLFGIGPRNWPLIAHNFGWMALKEGHGTPQQLACELGIPGALLWVYMMLGTPYALLLRYRQTSEPRRDRYLLLIGIVALPTWFVTQLVASTYVIELPYYVLLASVVALKVLPSEQEQGSIKSSLQRDGRSKQGWLASRSVKKGRFVDCESGVPLEDKPCRR